MVAIMQHHRSASSDGALIARALLGDDSGFEELVERYTPMLLRTAWRYTRDEDDAEDVVAETFLRAYSHLEDLTGMASVGPWLRTIATNLCLDGYRKRRYRDHRLEDYARAVPLVSSERDPARSVVDEEVHQALERALRQLSPRQRAAFVLFEIEGKDLKEISQELRCSEGTVKAQLHRARKRLRDLLGGVLARSEDGAP